MPLSAGEKLGPYEIVALLGEGGMGEVYRARDPRLGRDVAVKTSRQQFNERFEREARAVAALNHPNICHLYDVGPDYLVMELVEGANLHGPLPLAEVLKVARQIADALEAAHEKGIVHRDLKPANIRITEAGVVKILDFGLARLVSPVQGDPTESPTTIASPTRVGMILGTAAYMAPEQARGKTVDKRADIWAFGVVLYEIITGKQLFDGETVSDILAGVLKEEPALTAVPAKFRRLIAKCLQKDPGKRLRDIGDWEAYLGESEATSDVPRQANARPAMWTAAAALVFAGFLGFIHFREKTAAAPEAVRFEIPQPANMSFGRAVALSPDGHKIAFVASQAGAERQIWIRSLDAVGMHPLPGTENVAGSPFWSWDSRYLVFTAGGKLRKIDASGGPAQTLCDNPDNNTLGGFWTRDNKIVFGGPLNPDGLLQVDAAGGTPSAVTSFRPGDVAHGFPSLLPDGRHFLYAIRTETGGGIYVGSLDAKPNDQFSRKILSGISIATYVPSSDPHAPASGYVLFVRGGTLMAQPFDDRRLNVAGEAFPVAEHLNFDFSAQATGGLVYRAEAANPDSQLTWFDRKGTSLGTAGDPSDLADNSPVALSPDGKRAAFARTDPRDSNTDIWLYDFARNVATRVTLDRGDDVNPVWSPTGKTLAFAGQRNGVWGIYQRSSDLAGGEELLYKSSEVISRPSSWSADGRFLLFTGNFARFSVWRLPLQAPPAPAASAPQALTPPRSEFDEQDAHLSPDGRYFACISASSGRMEAYVRPFDGSSSGSQSSGGALMISKDGARAVRWRGDGKEIFYTSLAGDLMSVDVSTRPALQASVPKLLFKAPARTSWDVTADGQRFLFAVPVSQSSTSPYTVVLNWQALSR